MDQAHAEAHCPSPAAAVLRGVRSHLGGLDPAGQHAAEDIAALIGVAEDLLQRAAFDADLHARRAAVSTHLTSLLPDGAGDPATAVSTLAPEGEALRELVRVLWQTDIGQLPDSDRLDLPTPAHTQATSAPAVAEYLRDSGEDREVVDVKAVAGGFSKETILVTLNGPKGTEQVVLRKVASGRAADSIADEYAVLRFVADRGIAVAEPLWMDSTGGTLGAPLFASRRMPGRVMGTVAGPTGDASAAVAGELAELLGTLHALDVTGLTGTPRPPMGGTQDLLAAIDGRAAVVDEVAEAMPDTPGIALHRALLAWLRANVPRGSSPSVLVHGDVGFHNLLVDDERISALLDWELCHLGRPAEDLAYVRPSVAPLLDWTEFLRRYNAAGGHDVEDSEMRFFTVWQDVWRAVSCLRLRAKFLREPARLADGVSGMLLGTRFLDSALRAAFGG